MENEPESMPESTPAPPPTSPWVDYLTGNRIAADRFLKEMTTGQPKQQQISTIPRLDEDTRVCFAEALAARPGRMDRLLALVQAAAAYGDPIHRMVGDLAEASITQLGMLALPDPLDATAFHEAVSKWLTNTGMPLKKADDIKKLFLVIHFGRNRQLLDPNLTFSLMAAALAPPSSPQTGPARPAPSPPTALDVVLAIDPTAPGLSTVLAFIAAAQAESASLREDLQAQTERITSLATERTRLKETISHLEREIATLQEQHAAAKTSIAELEQEMVDLHNGYQHRLFDLRGHMRGTLQGQLTRWLETALDAARADPPRISVIHERLEDALSRIEKELQWLQPSD